MKLSFLTRPHACHETSFKLRFHQCSGALELCFMVSVRGPSWGLLSAGLSTPRASPSISLSLLSLSQAPKALPQLSRSLSLAQGCCVWTHTLLPCSAIDWDRNLLVGRIIATSGYKVPIKGSTLVSRAIRPLAPNTRTLCCRGPDPGKAKPPFDRARHHDVRIVGRRRRR